MKAHQILKRLLLIMSIYVLMLALTAVIWAVSLADPSGAPTGGELYPGDFDSGFELLVMEGYTYPSDETIPANVWHITNEEARADFYELCSSINCYRQISRTSDIMFGDVNQRMEYLPQLCFVCDEFTYRIQVINWDNFSSGSWSGWPIRNELFGEPVLEVRRIDLSGMPEEGDFYDYIFFSGYDSLNSADGWGWYSTMKQEELVRLLSLLYGVDADCAQLLIQR